MVKPIAFLFLVLLAGASCSPAMTAPNDALASNGQIHDGASVKASSEIVIHAAPEKLGASSQISIVGPNGRRRFPPHRLAVP